MISISRHTPKAKKPFTFGIYSNSTYFKTIIDANSSIITKSASAATNVISFKPITIISVFSSAPFKPKSDRINNTNVTAINNIPKSPSNGFFFAVSIPLTFNTAKAIKSNVYKNTASAINKYAFFFLALVSNTFLTNSALQINTINVEIDATIKTIDKVYTPIVILYPKLNNDIIADIKVIFCIFFLLVPAIANPPILYHKYHQN